MKIGVMLSDVSGSLFRRPATEKYPFVRYEAPQRLRGQVQWDPQNCTGCGICAKDCPANALDVIVLDKAAKRFVLRYHLDRCTFCAQCVTSCKQGGLSMSNDLWELAGFNRDSFVLLYGEEDDVRQVLADAAAADVESAASG